MQPDNQDKPSAPSQAAASQPTGRPRGKLLLTGLAVVVLSAAAGYWLLTKDVRSYEDCVKKYPTKVTAKADKLTCSAYGRTYTSSQPIIKDPQLTETYSDEVLTFKYPKDWSAKAVNNLNKFGRYTMTIESGLVDDRITSTNADTKSKITANVWVVKKDAPLADCQECTVENPPVTRLITTSEPKLEMQPVFGVSAAVAGLPVIMNVNPTKLEDGTQNYKVFVPLGDNLILAVRAQASAGSQNQMNPVDNTNDFQDLSVYRVLEAILHSLKIKAS